MAPRSPGLSPRRFLLPLVNFFGLATPCRNGLTRIGRRIDPRGDCEGKKHFEATPSWIGDLTYPLTYRYLLVVGPMQSILAWWPGRENGVIRYNAAQVRSRGKN